MEACPITLLGSTTHAWFWKLRQWTAFWLDESEYSNIRCRIFEFVKPYVSIGSSSRIHEFVLEYSNIRSRKWCCGETMILSPILKISLFLSVAWVSESETFSILRDYRRWPRKIWVTRASELPFSGVGEFFDVNRRQKMLEEDRESTEWTKCSKRGRLVTGKDKIPFPEKMYQNMLPPSTSTCFLQ